VTLTHIPPPPPLPPTPTPPYLFHQARYFEGQLGQRHPLLRWFAAAYAQGNRALRTGASPSPAAFKRVHSLGFSSTFPSFSAGARAARSARARACPWHPSLHSCNACYEAGDGHHASPHTILSHVVTHSRSTPSATYVSNIKYAPSLPLLHHRLRLRSPYASLLTATSAPAQEAQTLTIYLAGIKIKEEKPSPR
jgi:hypothetical protein